MSDFITIDNERDEDLIQKLRAYDITKEPELAVDTFHHFFNGKLDNCHLQSIG